MREALFGVAIGRKGVGKTYQTLSQVTDYVQRHKRKVLILDVNNEYVNVKQDQNPLFVHARALALQDVPKWTHNGIPEARRVSILKPEGGKMTLDEVAKALFYILQHFQNGLLLIEDINKYVSDSMPNDLIGSIVTQRHMSVDIITHFQTIGKIAHPKIWGNVNWIRMHKCEDSVQRHESKFGGDVTHLLIMESMVNNEYKSGNKRFFVFLNKDTGKISGDYTKAQFEKAIELYLSRYPSIISKEASRVEVYSGKKVHKDRATAVRSLMSEYYDEFYAGK